MKLILNGLLVGAVIFGAGGPMCVQSDAGHMIDVDVPGAGPVSLAVYNADGVLVRTLWDAVEQPVGKQHVAWDLLDNERQPVVPPEPIRTAPSMLHR